MFIKTVALLAFTLAIAGCNKNNQDLLSHVSSASLQFSEGYEGKNITLTDTDIRLFSEWVETKKGVEEKKKIHTLPQSPQWCFVFNEGIKGKLMIYCFYHHLNAMALYKDDQANTYDFFPVSEADKTFFKTSFHDLSQLIF